MGGLTAGEVGGGLAVLGFICLWLLSAAVSITIVILVIRALLKYIGS